MKTVETGGSPKTIEEAKENLLAKARSATVTGWIRENPTEALLTAFLAGIWAGGTRETIKTVRETASILTKLIK